MTLRSTPRSPAGRSRSRARRALAGAAAVLMLGGLWPAAAAPAGAQSDAAVQRDRLGAGSGAIGRVNSSSDAAGELTATWNSYSPVPSGYEVYWARDDRSLSADQRLLPTTARFHLTGLDEGRVYRFVIRSLYGDSSPGQWSFIHSQRVSTAAEHAAPDPDPDPDPEPDPEPEPEPFDGVAGGTMTVGANTYKGAALSGYAALSRTGSFEADRQADPNRSCCNGGFRIVAHLAGSVELPSVGETADPLIFAHVDELATPFTLLVGDLQVSSAHAIHPGGDMSGAGRFWVWDNVAPGWETGDEVAVGVTEPDELLAGTEPVWHSELTVGRVGTASTGYLGFQDRGHALNQAGSLSPRSATVDGDTYEFIILARYFGNRDNGDGTSHSEALDFYAWDRAMPSEWVLTVAGHSFRLGDGTEGFLQGGDPGDRKQYKVYWTEPGIELDLGATYPVTLSRPADDAVALAATGGDAQPEHAGEEAPAGESADEDQAASDPAEPEQAEPQRTPLTARFVYGGIRPHSGDGSQIILRLWLSEDIPLSYRTLRDAAFEVTGGRVVRAQRMYPPANQWWKLTLQADGDDPMHIVLPASSDCDAAGAICAADGTKLTSRNAVTIPGPDAQN